MIHHGDCLDVMATFEAESVSAIVTDPPYGIRFMGKAWDGVDIERDVARLERNGPSQTQAASGRQRAKSGPAEVAGTYDRSLPANRAFQAWCEEWAAACYRIAKPGAHLLAFGGTRTVHRLAAAIEDAGWEIRDMLVWAYASGFPKSHNLDGEWNGWGTALKPAWEPIVMARKPLRGTVAANVLRHGTGALNIDGTRIALGGDEDMDAVQAPSRSTFSAAAKDWTTSTYKAAGRWPANVILTDAIFDGGVEGVVGGGETTSGSRSGSYAGSPSWSGEYGPVARDIDGDSGTYSRFFLIPKSARAEREPVLGGLPLNDLPIGSPGATTECVNCGSRRLADGGVHVCRNGCVGKELITVPSPTRKQRANVHPTVKPLDLMRHLVRLVTPSGGLVLDPFLGSGTTAIACEMEGFPWLGIEKEADYVAIAEARLNGTQRGMGLVG